MISVSTAFHNEAKGQVIQPVVRGFISFTKNISSSTKFFQIGSSKVNGTDILKPSESNPIQLWDKYDYTDYSDRLVKAEWSRSIEFPYTVQTAIADLTFDNHDLYFLPYSNSAISNYNLPGRPTRISAGYAINGVIPQLVGTTQGVVKIDDANKTATYHIVDFLGSIAEQSLASVISMRNVRTDEALAAIVQQFGVLPSQYSFDKGTNQIPFVFFDTDVTAGEAIRKLVQAEGGRFWLDELGILRFQSRVNTPGSYVAAFSEGDIIKISPSTNAKVVNYVNIKADIREVQEWQSVYTKSSSGNSIDTNLWVVPANSSHTWEANLTDPCYDLVTPLLGKNSAVSWFTARAANGTEVTSGVSITATATHTNSYSMTFRNTNNFPVEIDEIELWGEPAKVIDSIDLEMYDDVSLPKYGKQMMQITDNQFIQSYSQAQAVAKNMLYKYGSYCETVELEIKGDVSLQLGDVIRIAGPYHGAYNSTYMIESISHCVQAGLLTTKMTVQEFRTINYFKLNTHKLNSTYLLG